MAKIIKGNHDGKNGENDTYSIQGRNSNISRKIIIKEIKEGKHPNFHVYKINNHEYVRGDLDGKTTNNINDN